MKIALSSSAPTQESVDLIVVGCDDDTLDDQPLVTELDRALSGFLRRGTKDERFRGKPGQALVLVTHDRLPAARVALLGVGKRASLTPASLRPFAARAARLAQSTGAGRLAL